MTNLPCNMVRFVSYNSRGLNVNKRSYLRSVLADCDILLLQEHWLSEEQLNCLNTLSTDHMSVAVSGFEYDHVLSSRLYGRCAILWLKALFLTTTLIFTHSRRIFAMLFNGNGFSFFYLCLHVI